MSKFKRVTAAKYSLIPSGTECSYEKVSSGRGHTLSVICLALPRKRPPSVVQQLETALRKMQERLVVVDYGEIRVRQDKDARFYDVDVYVPEEVWMDDGDVNVTASLLEFQTAHDLISPYIHPTSAPRVV